MSQKFFVAGCVFTEEYPALGKKVRAYVRERFNLPIIRCCVDKYKVAEFEMPITLNIQRDSDGANDLISGNGIIW